MKLIPEGKQIIGRIVIKRIFSTIIRLDEAKETTKFVLIDAVGPDAAARGYKVGDIVLPIRMSNVKLDGGAFWRPLVNVDDVAAHMSDVDTKELGIQTDSATEYVDFDAPRAALSIAESPSTATRAAVAA